MNNAGYVHEVYNSIRNVDQDEWNSLRNAENDVFMDPRFIEAVENSMGGECRFRHVVVRDAGGRPMATACLSSFEIGGATLAEGRAKKVLEFLERLVPWAIRSTLILCGLPVSAGQSQIRFAPEADHEAALKFVDVVACEFARAEWARLIIFKEIDPAGCRDLNPLLSCGYRRADSYPVSQTLPDYRDFDDYLSHVNWKRRAKVRRSQRKFAKSGLRVADLLGRDHVAELYTDDVHKLFEAVADHSELQFGYVPAAFFREIARLLPDNTAFTFVYQEEKVVGFMASIFSDTTFHGLFVGLDYEVNSQSELYFNLLYRLVDLALRRKAREISVGQTADELKNYKLGCYQVPMSIFVKGGRWSTRLVLKLAFSWIFPSRPITFPRETVELNRDRREAAMVKNTV
jgi:hypothetical protein